MSLLFDENLSRRLVERLKDEYPGAQQVVTAGLGDADDRAVWNYAKTNALAIVSKDSDFHDLASALGPPPKVIWLRVGNGPTSEIEHLLRESRSRIAGFLGDPKGSVLELP